MSVTPTGAQEFAPAKILDHLNTAVILIGPELTVYFTNRRAVEFLSRPGVLRLDGRSQLTGRAETLTALKAAVGRTLRENTPSAAVLEDHTDEAPAIAVAIPFHPGPEALHRCAIVLIRKYESYSQQTLNMIRVLYGLSKAEAEIALELTAGADLNEISEKRNVTLSTIRTQIASVMAKTGTHRQASLVALVARIGACA